MKKLLVLLLLSIITDVKIIIASEAFNTCYDRFKQLLHHPYYTLVESCIEGNDPIEDCDFKDYVNDFEKEYEKLVTDSSCEEFFGPRIPSNCEKINGYLECWDDSDHKYYAFSKPPLSFDKRITSITNPTKYAQLKKRFDNLEKLKKAEINELKEEKYQKLISLKNKNNSYVFVNA